MSETTKNTVKSWMQMHNGDADALARWMSQTLRLGGMKACRKLIAEAMA